MSMKLCKRCEGTGRTLSTKPFMGGYECPSCNGTGLHGEPGYGLLLMAGVTIAFILFVYWLFVGSR